MGTLAADLTEPGDFATVEEKLRSDANISLLVNNAGVGTTLPFLQTDIDIVDA